MIIDCHGHYTTSPSQLQAFRDEQLGLFVEGKDTSLAKMAAISDGEIIDSIENNQLKLIKQRGGDLTIFSPKASAMGQHQADLKTSIAWAQESNNLIYRVCELFPENFAPGCQLPQEDGQTIQPAIDELRRCVEMGFVGFNLNPDPSGGHWTGKPLTDPYWYPLYEVMMELDVPAMIHVSGSCNECHHTTGAHYINGDTSAFMQLVQGDLFARFPSLRMIIPHGGGAVPFGSEMLGAVKGIDPNTGDYFDDTKKYVDQLDLTDNDRYKLFEGNARRVFPRLDQRLTTLGLKL